MKNLYCIASASLLLVLFSFPNIGYTQNEQQKVVNPIPPEPTAAALGRYGEVPVSLYSGIPQISIPIYQVRGHRLSLPISLSYHAGGNKVEDIASWVGLGWSLQAGGVINRTVRGIPDKVGDFGFYSTGDEVANLEPPTLITDPNYNFDNQDIKEFATGLRDSDPDVFVFNFAGQSGKFIIDYDKTVKTIIPHAKLRVEPTFGTLDEIDSFVITTEDGTQFHFSDIVETFAVPACRQIAYVHPIYSYNSSWYLTQMIAANSLDTINFTYSSQYSTTTDHVTTYSSQGAFWGTSLISSSCNGEITYNSRRLEKIESDLVTVDLIANTDREDLPHTGAQADKRLDRIEIKDKDGSLIKAFDLSYSYFENSPSADVYNKRLRLDQIQEEGKNSEVIPPHIFEYNSTVEIPSLSSTSQDLWGYYNGKSNSSLIPALTIKGTALGIYKDHWLWPTQTKDYSGADRSIDLEKSQFAILTKITYPTGGYSTFEYEGNNYNRSNTRLYPDPSDGYFDIFRDATDHRIFSNPTSVSTSAFYPGQQNASDTFDISFSQTVTVNSVISGPFYGPGQLPSGEIRQVTLERIDVTPAEVKISYDNECSSCPASYLDEITLEPGTYRVTATATIDDGGDFNSISLQYFNDVEDPQVLASGGLRVKRIASQADTAQAVAIVKRYKYTVSDTSSLSSGILRKPLRFFHCTYSFNGSIDVNLSSHPNSGRNYEPVYYSKVIVQEGESGENGRTEYSFVDPIQFDADEIDADFYPFPQATSYNWVDGLNEKTKVYTANGNILNEVTNIYSHNVLDEVRSYKFAYHGNLWGLYTWPDTLHNQLYDKFVSSLTTGYSRLTKRIEKRYDQNDPTKFITITTDYDYENDDHLLLTKQTEQLENGRKRITRTLYPHDAPNVTGTSSLIAQNSINIPIEIQTWIEDGSNNYLTAAGRTEYLGDVLSDEVWQASLTEPVSFTDTVPSETLVNSLLERRLNYPKYDIYGNIQELHKEDDLTTSFIWGYNSTFPIAQMVNAGYDEAVATLPAGDLSLLQGNSLTQQQVRDKIDVIRQALPQTQVTCFTYDPSVGMTSSTGPNGLTSTYEYDDLNRLKLIIDHNGNIVQKFQYEYDNDGTL